MGYSQQKRTRRAPQVQAPGPRQAAGMQATAGNRALQDALVAHRIDDLRKLLASSRSNLETVAKKREEQRQRLYRAPTLFQPAGPDHGALPVSTDPPAQAISPGRDQLQVLRDGYDEVERLLDDGQLADAHSLYIDVARQASMSHQEFATNAAGERLVHTAKADELHSMGGALLDVASVLAGGPAGLAIAVGRSLSDLAWTLQTGGELDRKTVLDRVAADFVQFLAAQPFRLVGKLAKPGELVYARAADVFELVQRTILKGASFDEDFGEELLDLLLGDELDEEPDASEVDEP